MKESVIRQMTRLAIQHQAVNLAQGFTDEAPLFELAWGGIVAILGGDDEQVARFENLTLQQILDEVGFRISPPEGSYYLFADYRQVDALRSMSPVDAAMLLIEKIGVASVPGDNFYRAGNEGDGYLRFAFARSLDSLREAEDRLSRHLS